jgi:hypothetical protein
MTLPYVRVLFLIAALYDGVLGVAFVAFGAEIYARFGVPLPNHLAYVHFPALLLVVFGVMFLAVALRPVRNRNLIPYGIGLKLAYGGTAFYYWLVGGGIPGMWKPFAVADLVFIGLFAWAYLAVGRAGRKREATAAAG